MNNKELIIKFYTAFQNKDYKAMASCYHKDIVFIDNGFGKLKEVKVKAMWQMLCITGKDLKIEFSNVEVIDDKGWAHWEAHYTFGKSGRKVHNKIDASFRFKDGLIVEHIDEFNLRKWAGQAFGLKGKILGGTKYFAKQLLKQTNKKLDDYILKNDIVS